MSTQQTKISSWFLSAQQVVWQGKTQPAWIEIQNEKIVHITSKRPSSLSDFDESRIKSIPDHWVVMPGLVDSHVHINEPGRTEWEGFFTATQAAAAGGVTTLVDMPLNCSPVTTSVDALDCKIESLGQQLHTDLGFWGGVIPQHETQLHQLVRSGVLGCKAFMIHSGIDEFPHADANTLADAMDILGAAHLPLLAHAELEQAHHVAHTPMVADLQADEFEAWASPQMNDPTHYAHYLASRPAQWEVNAIALLIHLMKTHQCPVHIVHLSAAEALPMIAEAKAQGLPLTVETCPHYLCLSAEEIQAKQTQFKCAPPIRSTKNREALWQGLADGTIDFIVSDHSPCTPQLKKREVGDFEQAWGGISSLQLGLANIWTEACVRGFGYEHLVEWLSTAPARLCGLHHKKGKIDVGYDADFVIWDPQTSFCLEPKHLYFKHKMSPYLGQYLQGEVKETYLRGDLIYQAGQFTTIKGQMLLKHQI